VALGENLFSNVALEEKSLAILVKVKKASLK